MFQKLVQRHGHAKIRLTIMDILTKMVTVSHKARVNQELLKKHVSHFEFCPVYFGEHKKVRQYGCDIKSDCTRMGQNTVRSLKCSMYQIFPQFEGYSRCLNNSMLCINKTKFLKKIYRVLKTLQLFPPVHMHVRTVSPLIL